MTPLNTAQISVLALIDKIFAEFSHLAYIDRVWVMAHCRVESGFDAGAVGDHGSLGLFQVIPSTAAFMGETGSQLDPEISARTAVKYMDFCTRDIIRVWNAKYGHVNSVARSAVVEAFNEGQGAVEAGKRDDAYWYKVYAAWMILSAQIAAVQILSATHAVPATPSAHLTVTP